MGSINDKIIEHLQGDIRVAVKSPKTISDIQEYYSPEIVDVEKETLGVEREIYKIKQMFEGGE